MNQLDLKSILVGDLLDAWIAEGKFNDTCEDPATAATAMLEVMLREYRHNRDTFVTIDDVIPGRYRHAAVTLPKMQAWAAEVARNALYPIPVPTGPTILLSGPTGRGKTHQVYGARRAFYDLGVPISWTITTASDLHGHLRRFDGTDATDYAKVSLLAIDDLGAGGNTQFNDDNLYRIINYRYENELPTVITTNLSGAQITETFGDRIADRLRQMCAGFYHAWTMADQDWRSR